MSKPKKKFGQTTVGRLLKASVGLINPTLGRLIQGDMSVEQVVSSIKNSDAPAEDKIRAQEMVLEAYEAEVADRASARQREMAALAAGYYFGSSAGSKQKTNLINKNGEGTEL